MEYSGPSKVSRTVRRDWVEINWGDERCWCFAGKDMGFLLITEGVST
jgi:hypothetical protein